MAAPSQTKPSTPRLSEVAKHVVVPKGVVSTGWPAVAAKCAEFGVDFRWWQVTIGRIILAKREDGLYASTIGGTGLSIPRQVGKTFLVGMMIFALCLLRPNLTVVWSAHRLRTAEETFKKMQAIARRGKIAPFVERIVRGSGEESIEFTNGSRIMFGARAAGFGRGFDEVDVVVYDEAQILGENALDDMVPATNQSRQPEGALMLFMGTPPKPTDSGEVFTRMRNEALSGEDDDTAWVEFGADDDYEPTPLPAPLTERDWEQIRKANPSFPDDTSKAAILRMRKKLGAESFKREGAGVWDRLAKQLALIPADVWGQRTGAGPGADEAPTAIGLDRWYDGTTAVCAAWRLDDDRFHVELLALDVTADATRVVDWVAEMAGKKIPVLAVADSPAAAMIPDLVGKRVKAKVVSQADFSRGCQAFVNDGIDGTLQHAGQEQLADALAGAVQLPVGKAGAWVLDRRSPDNDISSLVAAVVARHGATTAKKRRSGGVVTA